MGRLGRALSLKKKLGRPHERASANKNRNTSVKTHQERKEEKNQLQAVRDLEQSLLETGKAKRVPRKLSFDMIIFTVTFFSFRCEKIGYKYLQSC